MDRGRTPCIHLYQKRPKFRMENHCLPIRRPHTIITNNGRQFIDRGLQSFYDNLGIMSVTASVEHPQTNGQAEATNKVILNEMKKRVGKAKGRWTEELI